MSRQLCQLLGTRWIKVLPFMLTKLLRLLPYRLVFTSTLVQLETLHSQVMLVFSFSTLAIMIL